jgi:hypothetical protein
MEQNRAGAVQLNESQSERVFQGFAMAAEMNDREALYHSFPRH